MRDLIKKSNLRTSINKINKLIFLTLHPISKFEEEKWCFDYLRRQGFEIEVLDLTKLLSKGRRLGNLIINSISNPLRGDFIHCINSYGELEDFLRRYSGNALFIDYLVGGSAVTLREERVFRLLKKHGAQYTFLLSGVLPLSSSFTANMGEKTRVFQSRVMKVIANPYKLLNYLGSKVILFLTKKRIAYPLPAVIFGGDSEVCRRYVEARDFDKRKIVPIHSFDYDSSILFLRSRGNKLPESQDICVFLDEAATHHSDFTILGIKSATPELYFSAMTLFFDFIEKNTKLKVVIAAHPRSNYESMPDVFGARTVIKGKTVDLVARSKLVVMHMSASLSYAVFFKKPVIPVKVPGMRMSSQMNLMVETMGATIGSKPIDIDKDELTSALLQRECNLEKYAEYEKRYVKTARVDELLTWEIVAKTVKNM